MPSRICRFLSNCNPEQLHKYMVGASSIITTPEIVELIQQFNVDNIPQLEIEFSKFLFTKGLQLEITHWILNISDQRKV